ncbi:DUF5677 domain-containing protein [Pseudomonas aeruginosa]|uniref:DUF5677 domain-containing protein n=1 Tax=Pseudomonas aeruginosa TaxID=287 RepID=UPI0023497269|nr:DUF5677 domain-containing protein [Pseudomonas aeruginosa]EIU3709426.1 hypothetical protein [Pseudomonas aeruginosa]EIU3904383.1 hypothetical protein [Pseudomonas aeruginosa]EKV3211315.1 hypothetical protein [Pseudomonas aeruginosa]WGW26600.1 DUF5677 domain-containing protein [Pseudomonas aeruginosa]WGW88244.1 DUF5677 domain-containing protein [Pseudomonas aeruginosa]
MADHLHTFRRQFRLDSELDLGTIRIAVNAVYDAQAIGFSFLSDVEPPSPEDGFRIHAFLNLMSRIYEHAQAMLVALATGSPASCEALGRTVVEGSVNLMYLATVGNASTLVAFLESWVREHKKKLGDWGDRVDAEHAESIGKMIAERKELVDGYAKYLSLVQIQCQIEEARGSYVWPSTLLKRFELLGRQTDYYESYHRLSGASHITGEDTLTALMALSLDDGNRNKVGAEAWAYSTMMSRLVCVFFVEAVASCVIGYGRRDNEDLQALRRGLAKGVHELAEAAGVPQV